MMAGAKMTAERLLLELGKWPSRLLQFSGYFPYNFSSDRLGIPRYSTPLVLWSIVVILLRFHHDYELTVNYDLVEKQVRLHRSTDRSMVKLMIVMLSVAIYWFRISPFIYRHSFEEFWNKNIKILNFIMDHPDFQLGRGKHLQLFKKMQKHLRGVSLSVVLITLFEVVILVVGYFLPSHPRYQDDTYDQNVSWHLRFASYSWCFTTFVHGFLQLQLLFFMSVYGSIFTMIGNEFQDINSKLGEVDNSLKEEEEEIFSVEKTMKEKVNGFREVAEERVRHGIDSFRWMQELVTHYSSLYGKGVIIEVGTSSVLIVVYAYLAVYWFSVELYGIAAASVMIVWLFAYKVYTLTTESSKMTMAARRVAKETILMCSDAWIQDSNLLNQAKMIAMKALIEPPSVSPGNYFKLDRTIIVSILASGITYLIIMVQFRETENAAARRNKTG